MSNTRLFFPLLFALLVTARLCHVEILWAEETLPLAAAQQMRAGKVLYRDIWFDKPPFAPVLYSTLGAEAGWRLRLAGNLREAERHLHQQPIGLILCDRDVAGSDWRRDGQAVGY